MENAIFIGLFLCGLLLFFHSMGIDTLRILLNFIIRGLSGMIIITVVNVFLIKFYPEMVVKINEITVGISGIFGIWGVLLLYALRYYFTIF